MEPSCRKQAIWLGRYLGTLAARSSPENEPMDITLPARWTRVVLRAAKRQQQRIRQRAIDDATLALRFLRIAHEQNAPPSEAASQAGSDHPIEVAATDLQLGVL